MVKQRRKTTPAMRPVLVNKSKRKTMSPLDMIRQSHSLTIFRVRLQPTEKVKIAPIGALNVS